MTDTPAPTPRRHTGLWIIVLVLLAVGITSALQGNVAVPFASLGAQEPFETGHVPVLGPIAGRILIIPNAGMTSTPQDATEAALAAAREVGAQMNRFDPSSDIGRLNASTPGTWISVHPMTWMVLMEAMRYNRLSDGAFDVTVGPLLDLYEWNNTEVPELPGHAAIHAALQRVGMKHLLFERDGMRLTQGVEGLTLDLGAIAKGYAVDQAILALRDHNVTDAIVEIGGELRVIGSAQIPAPAVQQTLGDTTSESDSPASTTRPWVVGVDNPRGYGLAFNFGLQGDWSVATSGDYRKFFEIDGVRFSHIIDPRTGLPVQGGAISVTIISPDSCLQADALATTVSVLGMDAGREFLKQFPHIEALLIEDTGAFVHVRPDNRDPVIQLDSEPASADAAVP